MEIRQLKYSVEIAQVKNYTLSLAPAGMPQLSFHSEHPLEMHFKGTDPYILELFGHDRDSS